jgi:hypothetical protein
LEAEIAVPSGAGHFPSGQTPVSNLFAHAAGSCLGQLHRMHRTRFQCSHVAQTARQSDCCDSVRGSRGLACVGQFLCTPGSPAHFQPQKTHAPFSMTQSFMGSF